VGAAQLPQTPTGTGAPAGSAGPSVVTGLARFTFVGRFDVSNPNVVSFALGGSRIGVRFTGTSLSMAAADSGLDFLDVVVDGNRLASPVTINPNVHAMPYTLVDNLAAGLHTAWISKRTESMQNSSTNLGIVRMHDMAVDANAAFYTPPEKRSRHLEFVGDSGYTGYGADMTVSCPQFPGGCGFSPQTENALKSIPQYTGDFLNADVTNASVTGKGVYLSVYDPTNAQHTLPVLYEQTLPPNAAPAWNFGPKDVDAVILSVGGDDVWNASNDNHDYFPNPAFPKDFNDRATTSDPNGADPNYFIDAMSAFLVRINAHYPNVLIVCVLSQSAGGNDIPFLGNALQQSIAKAKAKGVPNAVYYSYFTGDPKYTTYEQIACPENLGYGCDGHPSAAGAAWLAKRLATFVAAQKGWEAPPDTPYPTL
jgi:lysophospholipase L1-like esterase